ncbi:biotin--[acetyl-CoA-carboxylase] ligase [Planococcus sp. APC 4015]|nr:biotin--[acetyl-CoA-carboxylase] ligase [Planococcus sp. APC 4015]
MTIPEHGYPLTAAISPRVQVVQTTDSTNADVVRHATESPAEWPHLSLLVTTDQRAGRGRLDRTWTAPAGTALAVSTLVDITRIPNASRGWLPLLAGAAMTRAIRAQLAGTAHTAELKWPNDVLVDGFKICGILAEVLPGDADAVVVGTGVNTTMQPVDLPVDTATSFAALGLECDDDRLLADYLTALDEQLVALADALGNAAAAGIVGEIEALCATLGRDVVVALPDGSQLTGHAQRLDVDGRLVVVDALGVEAAVSAGDVVHVR